ncbi:MAG: sigma-70 family RNA polymerase sigma factor [Bdellovibrionales bacterium]|nr:sigma-70 family RNA polymerase sigma factor [Bdellovibrionales bacterium]
MKGQVGAAASSKQCKDAKTQTKKKETKRSEAAREAEVQELILGHRENGRKLSRSILRRWRVRMPSDEIDSIVDLALCEAARRFSPERGASFMTFFFYHLRGHLVRSVARAAQASNVFMSYGENGGIDTKQWQHVTTEALWSMAPDHDVFGQRELETPENVVLRMEKIERCRTAVNALDDLEKEIITRSFSGEQALVDIAKSLGYSRCHISRVKKSALERLRGLMGGGDEPVVHVERRAAEVLAERNVPGRGRPKRRSRRRSVERGRNGLRITKAA